jgi:hypothetical protein
MVTHGFQMPTNVHKIMIYGCGVIQKEVLPNKLV